MKSSLHEHKPRRIPSAKWRELIKKVWEADPLLCPKCRKEMRIVQAAKRLGIDGNTLILWTSDNGDEDSHYERTDTWNGSGPFRGEKRLLYEGGIRVPLIAYWPGTIPAGSTTDQWTTQYDLMPTIADAGGQPITAEMDGIPIFPTLANRPQDQPPREYLYWEFYERGPQQAVHLGRWKGIGPTDATVAPNSTTFPLTSPSSMTWLINIRRSSSASKPS